jgi:molecular chaperone GrpE
MDDTNIQPDKDTEFEPEEDVVAEENLKEKLDKLRTKLKEAEAEKQKYLDGWQRAQAEFVNLRKRDEESKKEFVKFATENLVAELLSVVDSFSMAFSNKEAWEKVDKNWRSGVEYIYSQLINILKEHGLEEFNPLGEVFDPAKHQALENVPVEEKEKDHTIVDVIQKGYILHGKVVRPAKVKVGELK